MPSGGVLGRGVLSGSGGVLGGGVLGGGVLNGGTVSGGAAMPSSSTLKVPRAAPPARTERRGGRDGGRFPSATCGRGCFCSRAGGRIHCAADPDSKRS